MSKHLYIFVLCTLSLCTLVGCKKDKNEPETFISDKARPTWTVPANPDPSISMTAVIKVDLKAQYPDLAADFVLNANDMLAAFSGETCLGIAKYEEGLFFLYIASPVTGNPSSVTLRYYSAHYKNLFEAVNAFPFVNDTQQGTTAEPFKPAFVVAK